MLDTTFVLWLQSWASPALTEIMRAVSLCGYVPSCLAVAIVCGFGWRLRLGVTLILAIVFADAMTIVAKGAFASPRPHAVDARVRTLGAFESESVLKPPAPPCALTTSAFPPGTWQRPRHGPWVSPGLVGNGGSSARQAHGSR